MDRVKESTDQMVMAVCPACGSRHCQLQATARKTGVVVGGMLGALIASGFSSATAGAVNGAIIASALSRRLPATVTGAIGVAIIGFVCGTIAGHAIGAEIDMNILGMYQCRSCGFEFKA